VDPPAVVLLSGGLDSAVVMACARQQGFTPHALTIDYQQRHRVELDCAARVAQQLGAASHRTLPLNLRLLGGSALTSDTPVPKDQPVDTDGAGTSSIPVTYVPARNLVFLSLAAAYAETLGTTDLFIGVNSLDYSGYPDCRPAFIASMAQTLNLATRAGVEAGAHLGGAWRIHAPLIDLTKGQIVALGVRLGVDLSLTHSCYDPSPAGLACGHCDSCLLRARGFEHAGVPDPTRYVGGQ
jgi:7-cyano-7-deazaguanine synthase